MREKILLTALAALLILAAQAAAQTPDLSFSTIYSFKGPPGDGFNVRGGLTLGPGGVLYGTTAGGGAASFGTVFSLTPVAGGSWTETVLYSFPNMAAGASPQATVATGSNGVLYGTTQRGGASGLGTIFALKPPSSPGGAWTHKVLYSFQGGNDGATPNAPVVIGSHGVLYGTTAGGGPASSGTVYSLTPPVLPSNTWTESILYAFTGGPDGAIPQSAVTLGTGGVLYGTTINGGNLCTPSLDGCGVVYSLTPPIVPLGAWTETVLYAFNGGTDGVLPYSPVVIGPGGILYGTCQENGTTFLGSIYSLAPPSSPGGTWTETILYTFQNIPQGNLPSGTLVLGASGVLYGTTIAATAPDQGNVYSLTPPTSPGNPWTEIVLHTFSGAADGANPYAGLIAGPGGVLYGTTAGGGLDPSACRRNFGCGTVFSVTP